MHRKCIRAPSAAIRCAAAIAAQIQSVLLAILTEQMNRNANRRNVVNDATLEILRHINKTFYQIVKSAADQAASLHFAYAKGVMKPGQDYYQQYLNLADISRGNFVSSRVAFLQALDFAISQLQTYGGREERTTRRINDLMGIQAKIRQEERLRERYST